MSLVETTQGFSWAVDNNHDAKATWQRYMYSLSPDKTRGTWKREELQELSILAQEHPGDWKAISNKLASKHSAMQVQQRVMEGGKPGRKWTASEDMLLKWGVVEFGRKFSHIAVHIADGTGQQCHRRWTDSLDTKWRNQ